MPRLCGRDGMQGGGGGGCRVVASARGRLRVARRSQAAVKTGGRVGGARRVGRGGWGTCQRETLRPRRSALRGRGIACARLVWPLRCTPPGGVARSHGRWTAAGRVAGASPLWRQTTPRMLALSNSYKARGDTFVRPAGMKAHAGPRASRLRVAIWLSGVCTAANSQTATPRAGGSPRAAVPTRRRRGAPPPRVPLPSGSEPSRSRLAITPATQCEW